MENSSSPDGAELDRISENLNFDVKNSVAVEVRMKFGKPGRFHVGGYGVYVSVTVLSWLRVPEPVSHLVQLALCVDATSQL